MQEYTIEKVPVANLLLDVENPRHDVLSDQTETLRYVLNSQGQKIVNLARDIVNEGINPADLPIVVRTTPESRDFVVLEGNRRVATLKVLADPTLLDLMTRASLKKQLNDLVAPFSKNPTTDLHCVVFQYREDAMHWIQLRHTGENKGVGIVEWDAADIARFNEGLGKPFPALWVVEFVKQNAQLDPNTLEKVDKIPITSLARLVNDPHVRESLGIRLEGSALITELPKEEVLKGLSKVVEDVATKKINVNDIRSKLDRQNYIESLKPRHLPSRTAPKVTAWKLLDVAAPPQPEIIKPKKVIPPSTSRKYLIPSNCILKIGHTRINKIYHELKDLNADKFPNSCAVMLRVFLELSLDEYAPDHNISFPKDPKDPSLGKKLLLVAGYFEKQDIMTKQQLKPVRVAASSPDALFSTNTLNAYVHNKDFAPKSTDLKTTWDNMQPFMEKLWS